MPAWEEIGIVLQDGEVITLLVMLTALPVLSIVRRELTLPGLRWFVGGYLCLTVACGASVAESVIWPTALDLVEHLAYALGGLCLLTGVGALLNAPPPPESAP